jgi:hypothetical protein
MQRVTRVVTPGLNWLGYETDHSYPLSHSVILKSFVYVTKQRLIRNFVQSRRQVPRVVTGEKNSPTVAHACRKRRLKWILPQVGGWSTGLATLSL